MMIGTIGGRTAATVVCAAILAVAGTVGSSVAATLGIGTISGRAGNQVEVPLVLSPSTPEVGSLLLTFTYDSSTVTLGSCTSDLAIPMTNTDTPGIVVFGAIAESTIAPGAILTCSFTVSPAATAGALPFTIDPATVELYDANELMITDYTLSNGAVVVTSFTLPAVSSSLTVPVSYAPANLPALDYCVTESDTPGVCAWTDTLPVSYTFSTQGDKRLYAYTRDSAGHVSFAGDATVIVDLPPVVTDFTLPAMNPGLEVPVTTLIANDGPGAIKEYCLREVDSSAGCVWNAVKPTSYTFGSLGSKTLYAFVRDSRNQVSPSRSASVTVEARPTITAFTLQDPSSSLTVPITALTATDNGTLSYCVTESPSSTHCSWSTLPPVSFVFAGEGAKTLYAFAKDNVGYISSPATATATVDLPPAVTAFTLPAMVASLNVPVSSLTVSDAGSVEYCLSESNLPGGCVWSAVKPTSYTFTTLGAKTLYAFAKDSRSQISAPLSASVVVEEAPSVSFSLPISSASLTVPVTFSASDNGSVSGYCVTESATPDGCAWNDSPPSSHTFGTQGVKTLHAFARDDKGYVSSGSATVVVDLPPVVTAFTLPARVLSQVVPITALTASDGGSINGYCLIESNSPDGCVWSGTAPTSYSFATFGSKTLYAFARDNAGQVSPPLGATVEVDALPTVDSFSIPASYDDLTIPIYNFSASDINGTVDGYCLTESASDSGCAWSPTPIAGYTFATAGFKTLYAFAKDNYGNVSVPLSLSVSVVRRVNLNVTIAGSVPGTVDSYSDQGAVPEEITCDGGTCSAAFVEGDMVYLGATPAWYATVQWSGCTTADGSECQVLMSGDRNITATFVPQGNVRLATTKATYPTVQAAYNAASGGAIELKEQDLLTFLENLDFNRAIAVTLDGGRSGSFAAQAGRQSAIEGRLNISRGKVTIKKIIIR